MGVMHAPRIRHATHAPRSAGPTPPADAGHPADDTLDDLEALFSSLDEIPGHRIELLEGQIVVSPRALRWHSRVSIWLLYQFAQVCEANGWDQYPDSELGLPPTREIVVPDQIIIKDPETFTDQESVVPVQYALLVSEIVSRSSKRADREVKWLSYAKAGVPLYLLVDRFVEPVTITLFSQPGSDGYATADAVPAGPGGGKLSIPAPFDITLDTATMPMPIPAGEAT